MDNSHKVPHYSFSSLQSLPLKSKCFSQHLVHIKGKDRGAPENTMKAYVGVEEQLHLWTSKLGGQWYASRFSPHSLSAGKEPRVHWLGGWAGPKSDLDISARKKRSCLCQESKNSAHVFRSLLHFL